MYIKTTLKLLHYVGMLDKKFTNIAVGLYNFSLTIVFFLLIYLISYILLSYSEYMHTYLVLKSKFSFAQCLLIRQNIQSVSCHLKLSNILVFNFFSFFN